MKIRIAPINLEKAKEVKDISKNFSDVLDFQVKIADDINRVIKEVNEVLPLLNNGFDDSELKASIAKVRKLIPAKYDDSLIKKEISKALCEARQKYDDKEIKQSIDRLYKNIDSLMLSTPDKYDDSELKSEIETLKKERDDLKKSLSIAQAEFRSLRNITGSQIDELRRKLDTLTEIK